VNSRIDNTDLVLIGDLERITRDVTSVLRFIDVAYSGRSCAPRCLISTHAQWRAELYSVSKSRQSTNTERERQEVAEVIKYVGDRHYSRRRS
jgi:hypothetical protein